jgi:hypothetical protein
LHFPRWSETSTELHESLAYGLRKRQWHAQIVRDGLQKTIVLFHTLDNDDDILTDVELRFLLSKTPFGPLLTRYLRFQRPGMPPLITEGLVPIQAPSPYPDPVDSRLLIRQIAQQNYCFVAVTRENSVTFNKRVGFAGSLAEEVAAIEKAVACEARSLPPADFGRAVAWHTERLPEMEDAFSPDARVVIE